jgi:hypothetical protein
MSDAKSKIATEITELTADSQELTEKDQKTIVGGKVTAKRTAPAAKRAVPVTQNPAVGAVRPVHSKADGTSNT